MRGRVQLLLKLACCAAACALVFAAACKREQRSFRDSPPAARVDTIAQSPILPGTPNLVPVKNTYEENAYAVSQGQDLRSEEHTSELQSRQYLVCRLLLEKKKQ